MEDQYRPKPLSSREAAGDAMSTWEERMAERAARRNHPRRYGTPGKPLEPEWCRECWGETYVWLGNAWGLQHVGGSATGCRHECHDGEVWMAATCENRKGED